MPRITRAALATAVSFAALTGGATTAHADEATPRAATTEPSVVQLWNLHSEKCLTIAKGSLSNGANAEQSTCADDLDNQRFELIPAGSGTFEVRAQHSGRCLEVKDGGTGLGQNVQQGWCVDRPHQRWKLVIVDFVKELYELRPAHTQDRCIGIGNSSLADGGNVLQWTCNETTPGYWRLLPVKA
ncbi:RICIN domain-containing protein [Streptomyces sp. NPDC001339]|uniref:RICIN domain-containing protein n=1 Tax=Streptomyces sp. NPDC001339 TaxID=3364563 RepID=UPI0036775A0F